MKKEGWFYLAICLAVVAFLCISQFFSLDYVSKLITTSLALVSAVAFWLQFRRTERLNESNYILNMNNQFISNKEMTSIEHKLEMYYVEYKEMQKGEKGTNQEISSIKLEIDVSQKGEERQKLVNYLAYLEALAALVDRGVLHLDVIDALFSYRFFIAVNNPIVQDVELYPYADFYQGIFNLSERWTNDHRKAGKIIPMDGYSLSKEELARRNESVN